MGFFVFQVLRYSETQVISDSEHQGPIIALFPESAALPAAMVFAELHFCRILDSRKVGIFRSFCPGFLISYISVSFEIESKSVL